MRASPIIGRAGGFEPESLAYFAAMSSQPTDPRKALINTLISSLKDAGIWAKLDLLYLLASHDTQSAKLNAKTPGSYAITESGTVTWTTDRGVRGNGSNGQISTGFTPSTAGGNFSLNSAHGLQWVNNTTFDGVTDSSVGLGHSASTLFNMLSRGTSDLLKVQINAASFASTATATTRLGCRIGTRGNSSQVTGYVDGGAGTTVASTSTSLLNQPVLMMQLGGGFNGLDRFAAMSLGGHLTSTEASNLYSFLNTYLTAIGAN